MNIVILDDSFTVRMIIESLLEDLGIREDEVHGFDNGFDALKYIEKNGVDIIFSDVNMPKMDGYEFAFKLFKMQEGIQNSFFVISGDETRESYRRMKQLGVHRFLRKPIDSEHFNHFLLQEINKRRAIEELLK